MITAKRQLLSVLILVVICVSALATEPNEAKTELKFEISKKERQLGIDERKQFRNYVKPKYVAIFSMIDLSRFYPGVWTNNYTETAKMMLSTPAGRSMSEMQKELLKADKVIFTISVKKGVKKFNVVSNKFKVSEFGLFAFNVEDAKLVTEAFVETMTNKAREKLPPLLKEFMNERKQDLKINRERIADLKKKLSEKEPELKLAESAYRKLKNTDRYKILADTEAHKKARETIAQMNKMLSILDIELAGIREKLAIIEKYRKSDEFSDATLEKLEQMFVEQMVELRGAMGRKDATIDLRNRDKQFCDFFDAWTGLESEVKSLRNNLSSQERKVRFCEEEIANPPEELLPPKVLQNKVTIYPVLVEE
jgi:hypothetical protein